MKTPRDLSGRELVRILCRHWRLRGIETRGSHIILQTETPARQRIPVPDHNPLRLGTLTSILRFVSQHKGVEKEDVLRR